MMSGLNSYDNGARQYYSVVPGWDRVDPMAEKYYHISPYAYCGNNPVNAVDADGRDKFECIRPFVKAFMGFNKITYEPNYININNNNIIDNSVHYPDDNSAIHMWAHGSNNGMELSLIDGDKPIQISSSKEAANYDHSDFLFSSTNVDEVREVFDYVLSTNSEIWINSKDKNLTIVLHSCSTGQLDENGNCLAKTLSLAFPNAIIVAPSDVLLVTSSGDSEVKGPETNDALNNKRGHWNQFENGTITDQYEDLPNSF